VKSDFQTIVIPAVREYFEAEIELAKAKLNCADDLESVRQQVIRRARTASIELHQLTDAVGHGDPNAIKVIRTQVESKCTYLRTTALEADIALLRDVAEAFKHRELNRSKVRLTSQRAVATVSLGYGALRFGEGKYGGGEQVIVEQIDGSQRALSSILQNCVDAWRRYFALPLPELGYF
tara:strand:+ start:1882 stop:2418 length:537 start_codon:yes stop_codon:yes gene_type:complete